MTTRVLQNEMDRDNFIALLCNFALPCTATVVKGKPRTPNQNRLQHLWLKEAAEQLGEETPDGYRGYCKLHFGIPILRGENDRFREAYDRMIKPLSYEQKLDAMIVFDFPVTRLMTTEQKTRYLDAMHNHFTSLGVQLTQPPQEELK